ncbi:MAG: LD-carboxypeptidase [Treponema sp.]|nr:LD-carboxypeptidase [Treponema sp.]
MKIPKPLKSGSTIAITAPSFGCTTDPYLSRYREAVRLFEERGYKVVSGATVSKDDGLGISTSPRVAAAELMEFYLDPSIDAVISAGGGELMCETLSFIDFDRLKDAPAKWFMGYSDNTNFVFPLATLSGTAAIYGHCITGFGKPWEQCEYDTLNILEGKCSTVRGYGKFELPDADERFGITNPLSPYILTEKKTLRIFTPKNGSLVLSDIQDGEVRFEGILLGGCLDVLHNIAGTRFDGVRDFIAGAGNVVWALESCDQSPLEIRRSLWHLKECGWFDTASGFIIGRPLSAFSGEAFGVNKYNAVTDVLGELGVPVVMDADLGHVPPSMPLVIGSPACVSAVGDDICVEMELGF